MKKLNINIQPLKISPEKTDVLLHSMKAHPYLWAALVCLLLNPFYFGGVGSVPNNSLLIWTMFAVGLGFFVLYRLYRAGSIGKIELQLWVLAIVVVAGKGASMYQKSSRQGIWLFVGGCLLLTAIYYLSDTKKYKTDMNAILMIGFSFFAKFHYVFYTDVYTRQHDVGLFENGNGHANYILYLLQNHRLPNVDVQIEWQYYHPPLHHTISAIWLGIMENIFGQNVGTSRESLQTLTLFYAMTIVITSYRIFCYFKLEGMALYAPLAIVAFHPGFTILSASINNDVLSIALMVGAVWCTIQWYEHQTIKNILKIALCIGLGMMTKLSVGLVAPSVALVFLVVFIQKFKTKGAVLFKQYVLFVVVCVPLGLWFGIRNYINWKTPLTYVPELSKESTQYLGENNFISRITDFSWYQFKNVFEEWIKYDADGNKKGYSEFNPIIALMKSALYGEYDLTDKPVLKGICTLVFWISLVLAIIGLVAIIWSVCNKKKEHRLFRYFMGLFYGLTMVNFYLFARKYPFTCSMDFRYVTQTVIISALCYGLLMQQLQKKRTQGAKVAGQVMAVLSFVFAILATFVFVVCFTPAA